MDNFKSLLFNKKNEINNSLEMFLSIVKEIISKKNNEILSLKKNINKIDENKKINVFNKKLLKQLIKVNIDKLQDNKSNNKYLKKIIKKELKIKNLNKTIKNIQNQGFINPKNMEAFKIVAIELEEKEKIINSNKSIINNLELENKNLNNKINLNIKEFENFRKKIDYLNNENTNLNDYNKLQSNTIETLTKELQNKNSKIKDLKNYFIEILDNYNDIIQQVE